MCQLISGISACALAFGERPSNKLILMQENLTSFTIRNRYLFFNILVFQHRIRSSVRVSLFSCV